MEGKQYVIDKPVNCRLWYLWDGEKKDVLKTGEIETVTKHLVELEKEGKHGDKVS